MSTADLEYALADLVARLDDREVIEVAKTSKSDFVRGIATSENVHRDQRRSRRRTKAAAA